MYTIISYCVLFYPASVETLSATESELHWSLVLTTQ